MSAGAPRTKLAEFASVEMPPPVQACAHQRQRGQYADANDQAFKRRHGGVSYQSDRVATMTDKTQLRRIERGRPAARRSVGWSLPPIANFPCAYRNLLWAKSGNLSQSFQI